MIRYELKKLLGNKFVVFFFAFLFLANAVLAFVGATQYDTIAGVTKVPIEERQTVNDLFDWYGEDPEAFLKEYNDTLSNMDKLREVQMQMSMDMMMASLTGKDSSTITITDYWPEYNEEIQAKITDYATHYKYFNQVKTYLEGLPAQYDSVISRAESAKKEYKMLGYEDDDYLLRYQDEVIATYEVSKLLPIELERANGWAPYFSFTNGNICLMLFLLVLIPAFFLDEKSNGTQPIIRATYRGRVQLVLSKYAALFIASLVAVLTFSAGTMLIYGVEFGGYSSLGNFVQIFSVYANCPYIVTVGDYLALSLLIKTLTLFALGSVLLTASLLLKNHILTYLAGLVVSGANFIFYFTDFLDVNSPLRLLNLFTIMDTQECFSRYYALNVFNRCLPYLAAIFIFLGLIAVVTAVLTGWLYCRTPGNTSLRSLFKSKKTDKKRISLSNLAIPCPARTLAGYEFHKHLIAGGYILLVLLLVLIKGYTLYNSSEIAYSFTDTMYKDYIDVVEGEITDEKLAYLEAEDARLIGIIGGMGDVQQKWMDGLISSNEYYEYQDMVEEAKAEQAVFNIVLQQRDYLLEQRDAGYECDFLYTTGWNAMFSRPFDYLVYAFVLVFATVMFTSEYGAGVSGILRATKKGRRHLFLVKYALAVVAAVIVGAAFGMLDHYQLVGQYAFTDAEAQVQSIQMLGGIPWKMTIHQYLMLFEVTRVMGGVILAVLTVSLSLIFKKPVNTMAVTAVVTLIPYVLRRFGLEFTKYFDFTRIMSANGYLTQCATTPLYAIVFTAAVLGGTGAAVFFAYRQWAEV